jgi:nucleotide-binding universal stress UspA family protein
MQDEFSQVVVGFDFSHSAHAALARAIKLAARAPWHVLHIVSVIDPHWAFPAVPAKHVDDSYPGRVREAVLALVHQEAHTPISFTVHARVGKPVKEILAIARDVGADLIIVGSRGVTGVERAIVGSTSERIARDAHCTVEIARENTYGNWPVAHAS